MEGEKEGLSAQNGCHKEGVVLPGRVDGGGGRTKPGESSAELTPHLVPAETQKASAPYLSLSLGSKMVAYS